MTNTPDIRGGGTAGEARFAGQSSYRGLSRPPTVGLPEQPETGRGSGRAAAPIGTDDHVSHAGDEMGRMMPTMLEPPAPPSMSPDSFPEPTFPPTGWLDDSPTGSLADHPLLRGLLLELPPKGSTPPSGWLDRWFDAARSILDLLYQDTSRSEAHR